MPGLLMKEGIWLCVSTKTLKWVILLGNGTAPNRQGASDLRGVKKSTLTMKLTNKEKRNFSVCENN